MILGWNERSLKKARPAAHKPQLETSRRSFPQLETVAFSQNLLVSTELLRNARFRWIVLTHSCAFFSSRLGRSQRLQAQTLPAGYCKRANVMVDIDCLSIVSFPTTCCSESKGQLPQARCESTEADAARQPCDARKRLLSCAGTEPLARNADYACAATSLFTRQIGGCCGDKAAADWRLVWLESTKR